MRFEGEDGIRHCFPLALGSSADKQVDLGLAMREQFYQPGLFLLVFFQQAYLRGAQHIIAFPPQVNGLLGDLERAGHRVTPGEL